jgi:hypothetical protein
LVVLTHAVSRSRLVTGMVATNLHGAQKPLRLASRSKTRDWEDKAEMRGVEFGQCRDFSRSRTAKPYLSLSVSKFLGL